MIKNIIILAASLILLASCTESKTEIAEKPLKTIQIEVGKSEVVKLNGKEIHVAFLENQIDKLAEDFELISTNVSIGEEALTGTVQDVAKAIQTHNPQMAYQREPLK